MTPKIKRELRRRSAVEPVIGHLKSEHRMGRNYLWYRQGDATNAVLAAAGYNFRRLIQWLKLLLCQILVQLTAIASGDFEPEPLRGLRPQLINVKSAFFTDDKKLLAHQHE